MLNFVEAFPAVGFFVDGAIFCRIPVVVALSDFSVERLALLLAPSLNTLIRSAACFWLLLVTSFRANFAAGVPDALSDFVGCCNSVGDKWLK